MRIPSAKIKNILLPNTGGIWLGIGAILFFGAGLALRIWWIQNMPTKQMYDFATYQILAENIAKGLGHTLEGVPVAWQGSGYSYALGLWYGFMGNTTEATGKALNILLSGGTMILCWFIYGKLFPKPLYHLTAFGIMAFLPSLIAYCNVLGTETFFLFLLACLLTVQLYMSTVGLWRWVKYILLGLLCGLCTLTKPFMLAYPFILALTDWVAYKRIRQSLMLLGIGFLAAAITIAPWAIRNYRLFGRLIPVSYNSGYVLFINNNDTNTTGSWMDLSMVDTTEDIKARINYILQDGQRSVKTAHDLEPLLKEEATGWIKRNPMEFLKLGFLRLTSTFFAGANDIPQWAMNGFTQEYTGWADMQYQRNTHVLFTFFDMTVYLLSGAGVLFLLARLKRFVMACFTLKHRINMAHGFIFINIAFFAAVDFVYEGQARYIFPVLPFMICAATAILEGLNLSAERGEEADDSHESE